MASGPIIKDQRAQVVEHVAELDKLRRKLDTHEQRRVFLIEQRLALWRALSDLDPPVSWADLGRASGIHGVTVYQAVQRDKASSGPDAST